MRLNYALAAIFAAFLGAAPAAHALVIVTSTTDLADLARQLASEEDEVICLSIGTQDPHFVDPQPGLIVDLNRADLVVYTGLDLEIGWLPSLLTASANPEVQVGQLGNLDASAAVQNVLETASGSVSRQQGDVHPRGNPHYLVDPRNARRAVRAIAGRLIQLAPAAEATYTANLGRYLEEFDRHFASWEERLSPFRGMRVITYHRSWSYLAEWVGLEIVDTIEPLPGIPPDPAHVADLILAYRGGQVRALLLEPWSDLGLARELGQQIEAEPLVLPPRPGGVEGAGTYLENMDLLVERLASVAIGEAGSP